MRLTSAHLRRARHAAARNKAAGRMKCPYQAPRRGATPFCGVTGRVPSRPTTLREGQASPWRAPHKCAVNRCCPILDFPRGQGRPSGSIAAPLFCPAGRAPRRRHPESPCLPTSYLACEQSRCPLDPIRFVLLPFKPSSQNSSITNRASNPPLPQSGMAGHARIAKFVEADWPS